MAIKARTEMEAVEVNLIINLEYFLVVDLDIMV
jgi:hypothetical protein